MQPERSCGKRFCFPLPAANRFSFRGPRAFCEPPTWSALSINTHTLVAPTASGTFLVRRTECACAELRPFLAALAALATMPAMSSVRASSLHLSSASMLLLLLALVAGGRTHGGHMDKIPEGAAVSDDPLVCQGRQFPLTH